MKSYIKISEQMKANKGNDSANHRKAAVDAQKTVKLLREKRGQAIADGNQADYKSICQDIEYYEGRAKHEAEQAQKTEIPVDGFHKAWKDYREEYDREYEKMLKAYVKMRGQLARAYSDILEFVNEGNREKAAYLDDAPVSARYEADVQMNGAFPEYSPSVKRKLSADGVIMTLESDDPFRVAENASEIERGIYVEGGLHGETTSDRFNRAMNAPAPKDEGRFLWEENGIREYLTRKEIRERKLSRFTPAERKMMLGE